MIRASVRVALAMAVVGLGWISARAQASSPAFELVVSAPEGETTIECVRGCDLAWVERGVNPRAKPVATFTFKCSGAADSRCSSATVGGPRTFDALSTR